SNLGPLESDLSLGDFWNSLHPFLCDSLLDEGLWALVHSIYERIVETAEFFDNSALDCFSVFLWLVHPLGSALENRLGLPLFLPLKHLLRFFSTSNSSKGEIYLVPLRVYF